MLLRIFAKHHQRQGAYKKSWPLKSFLCVRIHPISSMPPSLFYAYWSWCILFGGWVDWTWWILKNSLIHFKSRLCKQINGVPEEKVKNVAILSVRLQLEDGLCKINTTVRVAGIQELKTIYFPAKAFLYWANCRSNAASANPRRISFHYFSRFFFHFSYCICTRNGLDWSGSIVLFLMWLKMWVNRESSLSLSGSHLM